MLVINLDKKGKRKAIFRWVSKNLNKKIFRFQKIILTSYSYIIDYNEYSKEIVTGYFDNIAEYNTRFGSDIFIHLLSKPNSNEFFDTIGDYFDCRNILKLELLDNKDNILITINTKNKCKNKLNGKTIIKNVCFDYKNNNEVNGVTNE